MSNKWIRMFKLKGVEYNGNLVFNLKYILFTAFVIASKLVTHCFVTIWGILTTICLIC